MSNWVHIADAADCPPGVSREIVAAGNIIALFNVDGQFYALDGMCPHQGGPLGKGTLVEYIVTCPWHGFQFDVRDGQHQTSAQLQQPKYDVKVENGGVFVELPGS